MVKFAHMADVHLGGWKQKPMQELNFQSFQKAIDISIQEKVEFLLIAGDLFDTAYPSIEILKETFAEFKKLKESGTPCFLISGSHDYSVSGKTFLDVLEKSGFCKNVSVFEDDGSVLLLKPTKFRDVVFYGYPGKKTGLDVGDLKRLKLEHSDGKFKILMLHTTIDKAVETLGNLPIDYIKADSLPETDYCALGHIHILLKYKSFVYPGPVFPNNFAELENLKHGHFCIYDSNSEVPLRRIELKIKQTERIEIKINNSSEATEKIISELNKRNVYDKIILLRISGEIESPQNQIKFFQIEEFAKRKGVYFLLKNTHNLKTKEIEMELEIEKSENVEEETIKLYSSQNPSAFDSFIPQLMNSLAIEKQEGETSETFSSRILDESRKILRF
ncbi:exonuclease SbcCD subunit D [Candidatus Pacearchaeota archaeon]|nr:exonuclease SbcCD subunit D [Candidatus Pacearchaeota archaeon]